MSLFSKLNRFFNSTENNQTQNNPKTIDRNALSQTQIDDMQKIPASDRYREVVYKNFYNSYPIKPFISLDRERNTNWLEQAELFSAQSIIPINMMTPYNDGLLPGHIYLLYWLDKNSSKRIPSYFEYKYGIEFEKEKQHLISLGYIDNDKLTTKGFDAISVHYDVIESHSPLATSAKKAQQQYANTEKISITQNSQDSAYTITNTSIIDGRNLVLISTTDKRKVFGDIELLNELLSSLKSQLKIREALIIPTSEIVFNKTFSQKLYTYLEYTPVTSNGKQSKYPITLHYATKEHHTVMPDLECFGNINYLKDNQIGSATLHFWYKNNGYHISLGMIDDVLSVKKVEQSLKGTNTVIYKK